MTVPLFNIYAGTEVGLLKVLKPKVSADTSDLPTADPETTKPTQTSNSSTNTASYESHTFGKVNRLFEITCMNWIYNDSLPLPDQIAIGRKNNCIQGFDNSSGEIIWERQLNFSNENAKLIGFHSTKDNLFSCADDGHFELFHQSDNSSSQFQLRTDLQSFHVHKKEQHIFATGGKEQDLCIYDLHSVLKEDMKQAVEPLFKAKNVKNDHLDLRVPVWIKQLQFRFEDDPSQVVVGTGYHQIRLYDTKGNKRRPVLNCEVGEHPIRAMVMSPDDREVIFSDNIGTISTLDLRTGHIVGGFKGSRGAVTSLQCVGKHLVSGGTDRFIRIHEIGGKGKLVGKMYIKQRLNSLLAQSTFEDTNETMWDSLDKEIINRVPVLNLGEGLLSEGKIKTVPKGALKEGNKRGWPFQICVTSLLPSEHRRKKKIYPVLPSCGYLDTCLSYLAFD